MNSPDLSGPVHLLVAGAAVEYVCMNLAATHSWLRTMAANPFTHRTSSARHLVYYPIVGAPMKPCEDGHQAIGRLARTPRVLFAKRPIGASSSTKRMQAQLRLAIEVPRVSICATLLGKGLPAMRLRWPAEICRFPSTSYAYSDHQDSLFIYGARLPS
jgi:hypothetical protein